VSLSIQPAAAIGWQCIIAPKDKSCRSRAPHKLRNFADGAKFPKKALASGTFPAAAHLMPLSGDWQAGADPGTAEEQAP
jgi:hypothetical protein